MEKTAEIHWAPRHKPVTGKLHVRLMPGRFQTLRRLASWPMIALFFGLAWVESDGQPGFLFSFEQHRIVLFAHSLSWRDLPILMWLLIASANLLFFTTVAYGRVWCGFACPQSVWTWMFIRIENMTEGSANRRAKSERQELDPERILRRLAKHTLWILLALLTAITFTGYFVPIRLLVINAMHLELSLTMTSWLFIATALTYINAGLVREKICLHACPYSRFQSSMFESTTKTVSYDAVRGEPRAKSQSTSGGCIDCTVCVQVCPTGIDIRDGLQAACIDCGACIDACDSVMEKINQPKGLIRFTSENQLAGIVEPKKHRPKLLAYGGITVISLLAITYSLANTTPLSVAIQRDRNTLFTEESGGAICNHYRIKIEDVSDAQLSIQVSLSTPLQFELRGPRSINMRADNGAWQQYSVCSPGLVNTTRSAVAFQFESEGISLRKESTFISPVE